MFERHPPQRLERSLDGIEELLSEVAAATDARAAGIAAVPQQRRPSAINLAHYLAVRTHDLRPLQRELAELSLSSLGLMEANVLHTLQGVKRALLGLLGRLPTEPQAWRPEACAPHVPSLEERAVQLLGASPAQRQTRILVTLPTAAVHDRSLLCELLLAGMDLVRLNLAHDGPPAWTAMVENLRAVEAVCGRRCRILVDLPGPKLRTGELLPGPRVVRIKPDRDPLGAVTNEARVVFRDPDKAAAASGAVDAEGAVVVPLTAPLAAVATPGDEIVVVDTRGRRRHFAVQATGNGDCRTTANRTAYVATGCEVELRRGGRRLLVRNVGRLPQRQSHLELHIGDLLVVTRDQTPGRPATVDAGGLPVPARVPCTLPEVFESVRCDQRILFDDGKIAGLIVANSGTELRVRITDVPPGGGRLRAEKGINLPDTDLHTSALTEHDLGCLDWVAAHADIVGMSFVQRAADVLRLQAELQRRGRPDLGIVLKIETKKAFERLPELLFAGLRSPPLGVMVARGDLAVEVGYARLAEVQEEILWLCEAAHVPVIWATQVLDSMAHTGIPSRAEVTDAAMGAQAECVMLNKGPHIVATTRFLGGVLERMQEHHTKKRSLLRRLRVAGEPRHHSGV